MAPEIGGLKGEVQGQATVINSPFALNITPNPFVGRASISYSLPKAGYVSLTLYDVTGALRSVLAQGYRKAGVSDFELRASDLPRGIYLLKFENESKTTTSKLIIE